MGQLNFRISAITLNFSQFKNLLDVLLGKPISFCDKLDLTPSKYEYTFVTIRQKQMLLNFVSLRGCKESELNCILPTHHSTNVESNK